jgi:hypothetical protein
MPSESKRGRLPFEPRNNKQNKPPKIAPTTAKAVKTKSTKADASLRAIPDIVSKRMVRRMVLFCGIPSALGMSSLLVFYWLHSRQILDLPPYIALLVSFGLLGLGLIGLSYGIFSASWDEQRVGGWLGIAECKINFQRTVAAWRESRQ